jgi:hypothetical protein
MQVNRNGIKADQNRTLAKRREPAVGRTGAKVKGLKVLTHIKAGPTKNPN